MLFEENQRVINFRINELVGKVNKVSLIDEKKAEEFKEKISNVEECALLQAVEKKNDKLILHDDSKDIFDTLNLIESEIDITLDTKNNSSVNLDRISSLLDLKEFILAYKKINPSDLQLNKLKKELVEKILTLLDDRKITIEDIKTFYDNLDIQIVKNTMFEFKKKTSTKEELIVFINYLDRIDNNFNQLFELYLGISYPVEEKNDVITLKTEYPSAYNKTISKLIKELADVVYENVSKKDKNKAVNQMLWENTGFTGTVYTLFTKTKGIISLEEKKFKSVVNNSELCDDVIGCISNRVTYEYKKFKNLRFLYILDDFYTPLLFSENQNLEYIYVKNIDKPVNLSSIKMSNLKEVHYEKQISSFDPNYFKQIFTGNYEIINENCNKILKKIQNQCNDYVVKK